LIFTAEAQRRGEDLGSREAAKATRNFGFGVGEAGLALALALAGK